MVSTAILHSLPNGLRIAVEPMPHARSVAVGVWVGAGAHFERPGEAGAAHFLEHMLFKGTHRRSGRDLAAWMDRTGGEYNATTGRESTCYYGWVLPEFWRQAVSILAELVLESRLDPEDVERERQVILEEIRGDEDLPENRVMADFDRALWGTAALGRPVAGTVRSVTALTRDDLLALQRDLYTPDNAVVSLAGAVDPDAAIAAVEQAFGGWQGRRRRRLPRPPAGRWRLAVRRRNLDQVHLVTGTPAPAAGDPALYPWLVLTTLLGGGASSRLFQRIREEAALAYQVYTFHEAYRIGGVAGIYAAVRPDGAEEAARIIRAELERAAAEPVPPDELDRARVQLKSNLVLGTESVADRMQRLGDHLLRLGRVVPPEEVMARIDAVTAAEVQAAAQRWLAGPQAHAALGPLRREDLAAIWPEGPRE